MSLRATIRLGLGCLLVAAAAWGAGGSGTADDPYVVTTVEELQAMRDDLAAHYVLGNDIDASATAGWNGGSGFEPVGGAGAGFTGVLDGRGRVIRGLHIDRVNDTYVGLFGVAQGAVIRNVRVEDAWVRGYSNTGILVGRAHRESLLFQSSVTGTVVLRTGNDGAKSGGLAGGVSSGSRVDQCFSEVEVQASGRWQVGGLVGYLRGVETEWPIASITDSYAAGTVVGGGFKVGNLLGDADGSRVDRCYSSGLGKALIGYNFRSPVISNSYWDADRGASSSRYGGAPRTTGQMMRQATFVGWDFDEIWGIDEGTSYPYLRFDRPLPMSLFHVGWLRLSFLGPGLDLVRFGVYFTADALGDGIEPELEEVTVEVGSFAQTLPPGSFDCRSGVCTYRGADGGVLLMQIREAFDSERDLCDHYAWVVVRGVDLSGTENPVELSIRIGDDVGTATSRLGGVLTAPGY